MEQDLARREDGDWELGIEAWGGLRICIESMIVDGMG